MRHDLFWAQLVSMPPAVPHAYRDATSYTVVLLCIAACGMEPPWAFGPQYLTDFTGPAGTGRLELRWSYDEAGATPEPVSEPASKPASAPADEPADEPAAGQRMSQRTS